MGRSLKGATHRCLTCGETNPNKFRRDRRSRCKKCHSNYAVDRYHAKQKARGIPSRRVQKNPPKLCTRCGESDPSKFNDDRCSECKKCKSAAVLARYREQQRSLGKTPKLRPRRKRDYTPAEVRLAARFGLTVEQYRQAKSEAQ